ncbi:hypothetical protein N9H78_03675 [Winogradskyella sp.]|nr:hypothetical protein [Winogradskyella sp.]MDA8874753.1 hypothetical protein [Winogradskyella sp.]
MDFQKLMDLGMDSATARYSDDGSAIERDRKRFVDAVASQDVYTLEEIEQAVTDEMNRIIIKMNEEFQARQSNA